MKTSHCTILTSAATALLLCAAFGMRANPDVLGGNLVNPDSAMRLVRLEAMIQAGAPLSAVARDGSGGGTVLHWSHLLDSALLVLAAPGALFVGWHRALLAAAVVFGPLSMAALGAALAWAVTPFADRPWRWLAAVLACVSVPVLSYGLPGVVHHHVLLAATAVLTAGWAIRIVCSGEGGVALGAWAAVAVWLSPESMPLSLMAICFVWWAWLMQPRPALARNLAECGVTMLAVVTAAWLVDPPAAGVWAAEQDRLSIIFVTLSGAAASCGLAAWAGLPRWMVLALGGALAGMWLAAFPVLLQGTYGLLPPDMAHAFMDDIAEMQPVTTAGPVLSLLLPSALAAVMFAVLGIRRRSALLCYAAACAAVLVVGGAQHVRFAAYPAVVAAALVPVALTALGGTRWRTAALGLAVLLPMSDRVVSTGTAAAPDEAKCSMRGIGAILAPYAGQVVLSNVNDTPDLLWHSQVLTVGSLYHRNPAGFMRLRAAWASVPGQSMPAAVAATMASLVLVCPGAKLPRFIKPGPTLAAALKAGDVPPWLHQAGPPSEGGFVLYAADPAGSP